MHAPRYRQIGHGAFRRFTPTATLYLYAVEQAAPKMGWPAARS
jgi:hypothetical protein